MAKQGDSSWESAERWYGEIVGEKGHYYHQSIILPNALRLLELKNGESILDLGCGSGVLARSIPSQAQYWGVDSSKGLLAQAKKMTQQAQFILGDATGAYKVEKKDFDKAAFILSLQNMDDGKKAIAQASSHLKSGGKLLLVLNHPCFRIPRQSGWEEDKESRLQYRTVKSYMSSLKIPIQTHPGKGSESGVTYSYHRPLNSYSQWLFEAGLAIEKIEEWCSDKKSEGAKARMEDRARREIPLFLAILATKLGK